MQRFWRSSTRARITRSDRGRRFQTDSAEARGVGACNGRFHLASGSVESVVSLVKGSRPSWIHRHCERSCARIVGLQAQDLCVKHADQSIPLAPSPATVAARLHCRFPMSPFASWLRMRGYGVERILQAPFLQSSWGYGNLSTLACESPNMCGLGSKENSVEDECDNGLATCNLKLKKSLLPVEDLADMLLSAAIDPDTADIKQIMLQLCSRFRRTPAETFLSDLQEKLVTVPLPISKTLLKKKAFLFSSPNHIQAMMNALTEFFSSGEKACSILARNPAIIAKRLEHLQQMLNVFKEFQIEKHAVERGYRCLSYDPNRVRDVLTCLKAWGVHAACINKMVSRDPNFLRYSTKEYTHPVLAFLTDVVISKLQVLQLLQDHPDILCRSVANSLMPKHDFCQKLGLNFSIAIRHTTYSGHERFHSQIEFFKEQGLSDAAIIEMVEREPRVLGKSKVDLKTKFDFLLRKHKRRVFEIIKFPACLCYSFKDRISPRFTYLENTDLIERCSLSYVLSMKSSQFRILFKVPESVKFI